MKKVVNRFIPFKGFKCMMLFGVLFIRKEHADKIDEVTLNHEDIHNQQGQELLWIFFYLWYFIEWLIKLFKYGRNAYKNISFEREANAYENRLNERKEYGWLRYL